MDNEILVSVSSIEPVYNKKGKITGWKLSAKYIIVVPEGKPSTLCFYSTKIKEYSFYDLFGWGHKCICNLRTKLLTRLEQQKR